MPEAAGARRWLALSPAQRMVWLDLRLGAAPLAYQLAVRCRIDGTLDLPTLRQSITLLAARHDALRLRIDPFAPRQWLADAPEVPLVVHTPTPGDAAALERQIGSILREPIPLGEAPLLRVDVLPATPQRCELVWRINHLLVDMAGMQLMLQQWVAIHNALIDETPGALPPGSSFVATLVADEAPAEPVDLAHWLRRFDDVPELVFERRKDAADAAAAAPLRWSLAGADYRRWRDACTTCGTTDQRVLLALLALAVGTRHDRRDLTIALALHGRDVGSRGVVGMLAAALPVRCRWAEDATLTQVVRQLSSQLDEDYRHQRTPVADIGRALGLAARGMARLFDISLSFVQADEQAAAATLGGAALAVEPLPTHAIVPLPLLVTHRPHAELLDFELGWDDATLDASAAASLADGLRRVIAAFCDRPSLPVAELEPASDAERARVLGEFNPPATPFADQATLHERVRAQARITPDALAVIDGDTRLSYAELDAASDALARRIHAALPAGAVEPVVGVALPRSAATVVSLLAILKAQAVYLPLDIAHPTQRLQHLLDDAQAALLIDAAGTAGLAAPRLLGDSPAAELPADIATGRAQRLAYVIYTSGSTGRPKPVGVSHRAAVNLAQARQQHDPIGPGCRVLAAISVGFDVSIGQLLLPLLSGATIVVAPPLRDLDAAAFWALLARHGVTHINSVPSFFDTVSESLQTQPEAARYRGLQRLMLGGEVLTGALARKLQTRLPGTQIVNMYGPTEACIDAAACMVPAEGDLPAALPIGRPLANVRAYVLDRLGRLLPPGVAGELGLAGAGLARGYLRRPGDTAAKFVPDAFAAVPGERLYRTGDRARWLADGQIEFLGRDDQQVKIRGFRVETGEVEAMLLAHPAVQQAAVLASKDAAGHTRLVAYVVAPQGADALKPWLAERLPDHMVPAAFIVLDTLPLTANGKIDRRALPTPDAEAFDTRAFVPPEGAIETTLAALWAELLAVDRIGRHDHFFELGGHSLLAITLVDRMRLQGLAVEVNAVFAQPTLAALARATRSAAAPVDDALAAPPCGIPPAARRITPAMLPMLTLSQAHIDALVARLGGATQVQDIYPLAPLQQGLLFHHLLHGEGDPYLTPMVLGFGHRGEIDAFIAALQQVVARHDVLRTSFAWEGLPQPVQVVWRDAPLVIEEQGDNTTDETDALGALAAQLDARHHRLDLTRAPLLRARCVHDAANARWLLGLALHHLVLDHVSVGLVMQEVAAIQRGEGALLPPARPFRDAVWQALRERHDSAEALLRARLGDVDTPTAPYGLADVRGGAAAVREARLALPAPLAEAARASARRAGVTLASLLHLAWALVLARTSGRDDVVFGTVLSGRMKPASRGALGLFINTLPLRLAVGDAPVGGALQSAQDRLLELLAHEHTPLALAQRCSGVAAPTPLFSALLNVRTQTALPESTTRLLWSQQLTGYPLALAVDDDGTALALHVQSEPPAEPARVARLMVRAVEQLVAALQHAPETPCAALDLIDAEERTQLLVHFQAPPLAVPRERTLHELVREQVARSPDALAVIDGALQLSYRELDARSDALARRLYAALPALAEPVVGVALPRSAATVVALLAILKARAVYLPLDIAYPAQRLQQLLDDAQAALLIDAPGGSTAVLVAPRLPIDAPIDAPNAALPAEEDAERAERLAYVIYTSGSTGTPKPVGVSHRAAINLAFARQHGHDPIGAGSRVLAAISVGFDVSIGQLLLPLLHGAAIVIAPPLQTLQPSAFWALLRAQRVTHINSVPSFFETVSEALPPEGHRGLQRLMLGGEVLTAATVRKLQQRLPGTQIVNMYGPTEACIDATAFVVPAGGELPGAVPIGRPLANVRVLVLDTAGRLAPVGVTGELCIGGAGLARGYLNRPEATAEKFVADPFSAEPNSTARLYRTGDLARWRADGNLEFLGRTDTQVKVRGFRVETGEIEATLLQHPQVRQAAVIARKDRAGHMQLLAYLVGEDIEHAADTVRPWLAERLPEHMLPAAFCWLAALPLTPNGKLDRQALPAVEVGAPARGEAPRGEAEIAVAAAWSAVLGIERVHRDDDFFALGGQSLLAITLVERLRQAGWRLDVPTLFAQPVLRAMAAACRADDAPVQVPPPGIPPACTHITPAMLPMVTLSAGQIEHIVATVPGGAAQVQDIYPLAPLQQGMLYHHLMQPVGDVYLTPLIVAFAQRAALDAFVDALGRVIARHDILRSAIAWHGLPEPVQVVWRSAPLALEALASAGESDTLTALKQAVDPQVHRLDLRRAPLLRAVAADDASNGRWLLALCLHHLALDHTSMDIVLQEIAAIGQGRPLAPPVPFRNLVWLAREGVAEAEHREFFSAMLADADAPTAPYGLTAVQGDAHGVRDARLELPAALAAALRREARAAGASAASLMHLAWALVLARTVTHTKGRDDVVFGTVLFGRMNAAAGADRALGMLINTLPLRVALGSVGAAEALAATHRRLAGLMRHEHAPLALAQRCSGVAAPAPLFTALFNHRHAAPARGDEPGFELVWGQERTGYPLSMAVDDDGSGFRLHVQSEPPAEPARVARLMVRAVEQLVAALQHAPETPCAALDLIDAEERAQLLVHFNPPPLAVPRERTLHELVRAQVLRSPDAVAVIDGALQLSYRELDARSDALARRLLAALPALAEPVVGVALPRSAATVVALLAILKARAVYLPLDIAYPAQRLQHLLDDAQAALLIDAPGGSTAGLVASRLPIDAPSAELPAEGDALRAERLAYVIYTSGSTGTPKPVGVSHRAAINLAFARQHGHDPIGAGSRVLAAISVGFDVSIGQLLLPLLHGAAIVIAPPLQTLQPSAFWALLRAQRVTHINSVPSFFETVSEALPPEGHRGLQRLMLGGEVLTAATVRKLQQRLPGTQIVNMYGPTEACIDATAFVVPEGGELPGAVPIGRPLANVRVVVLDAAGRLAPVGVTGELCIGGAGLARGYLNRPEATAEKFVADPFSSDPSERLYRTGDLARWRADGNLEFLGRTDTQVKVRGFRVETGEIEATLLQHPQVRQAAVIARKDRAGHMQLLAYLVGEDIEHAADTVRPWLAERLPEHMLPAAFCWLAALPLTTNGKLDRQALPAVEVGADAAVYVAPRNATEQALQDAWQAVLGHAPIGVDADFFSLGGHSLLALRLVQACQAALRGIGDGSAAERISLRGLLAQPSIAGMAGQALAAPLPRRGQPVVLRAGGSALPVFCVHPQSGTVWCFAELARHLAPGVPVYGLEAQGLHAGEAPLQDIPAMARAAIAMLHKVQPEGPYRLIGYSSGGVLAHEMAQQLRAAGAAVPLVVLLDSPLPDGSDTREPTESETLADAARLLGLNDAQAWPRSAAELVPLMRRAGLADADFGVTEAQRLVDTALGIVRATRRHVARPSDQPLVQIRATARETPPADWRALGGSGTVVTHDLPTDHLGLVGAGWAATVAGLINQQLEPTR